MDQGKLAIFRGVGLDKDDLMRRHIINELMCHSRLTFSSINDMFDVAFKTYFKQELLDLQSFIDDKLVLIDDNSIQITPSGRMLMRNIGMQFDAYLKPTTKSTTKGTYSRLI